jgi:hypothetical protein
MNRESNARLRGLRTEYSCCHLVSSELRAFWHRQQSLSTGVHGLSLQSSNGDSVAILVDADQDAVE